MQISVLSDWALAVALLTLRLAPMFAFAPPFSLLNVPVRIRVLIPLMLATCMTQSTEGVMAAAPDGASLAAIAASELLIGLGFAFALQAAFAALSFAGRVLDVQAGFGLATVLDPGTRAQSPLIGSVLVLVAAAAFFSADGHHDLLRLIDASLRAVPVGAIGAGWPVEHVIAHAGLIFSLGLAIAATGVLVLFLADVALGFMARTLPQMNILMIGLQVKSIALILTLVLISGVAAPALLRISASGLRFIGALEP
jgi:flagellar biosynthetic protein FliR